MMTRSILFVVLLVACVLAFCDAFVTQPLHTHLAPPRMVNRNPGAKRYYSDPLGIASSIYGTMLDVGGSFYRVILDTGSGILFLTGRNCTIYGSGEGCRFATNFYDGPGATFPWSFNECGPQATNSITYDGQTNLCKLSAVYADGSFVDAIGIIETATIGAYSGQIKFGLSYSTSDSFVLPGTDGIWGLVRSNSMFVGVPGPFTAAVAAGLPNQFAVCFNQTGGVLHLGGYNSTFSDAPLSWFTYDASAYHYELQVDAMEMGGSGVGWSTQHVVVDTGATLSYFPETIFNNTISLIETLCPTCPVDIFRSNIERALDPDAYPTLSFTMTTSSSVPVVFSLTGRQYLRRGQTDGFWAAGIAHGDTPLFGVSFMSNWYTVFDISSGRIGIGNITEGVCIESLSSAAPLTEITPGSVRPPQEPFALTPHQPEPMTPSTAASSPEIPLDPPTNGSTSLNAVTAITLFALLTIIMFAM